MTSSAAVVTTSHASAQRRNAGDWAVIRLGEVLTKSDTWVNLDPLKTYTEVSVRLWGRGVVARGERNGSEIGGTRRLRVESGQFILSRIDARNGAVGLVPPELDGAVVSNDFPTFDANPNRLLPEYLGWLSRTRDFVERCRSVSEGTTNRVRLDEKRFLQIEVLLPPVDEQRQIVAKIEHLAEKIDEVRKLREAVVSDANALCRSILVHSNSTRTPMRELVRWRKPDTDVSPTERYQFAGVYCFGRGVFRSDIKSGLDFCYRSLTRLNTGEFVYPKLMAWEGALAIVPPECDGCYVSPEFPVFEVATERVLPEVLDVYFRSPSVWGGLSTSSTGTNVRRRRMNPKDFLQYEFPLPDRPTQFQVRSVRAKVEHISAIREQNAIEFDALLPSILDKAFKGEL